MKVENTGLDGLKVISLAKFGDDRGFFMERFNVAEFAKNGLSISILQVNHSYSSKGVLRGLHFQTNPWQLKIVGCIAGAINDVAVDIRPESKTFGKHFVLKIESNETMLYIPHGFAHGFEVLSESAHLLYFTDALYNKESDNGIRYDSCGINWEIKNPLLSEKDVKLQAFDEYRMSFMI
jgi:dTDP-4-dehydrorhamnose 3,5-epimerase